MGGFSHLSIVFFFGEPGQPGSSGEGDGLPHHPAGWFAMTEQYGASGEREDSVHLMCRFNSGKPHQRLRAESVFKGDCSARMSGRMH